MKNFKYILNIFVLSYLIMPVLASGNQDIKDAENWLNNLTTMKAEFIQVSSDGSSVEGIVYIKKGKGFRFEYFPPSPLLIVGRGSWVIVQNLNDKTSDNYPISQTPLSKFLSDKVSLNSKKFFTTTKNDKGIISIQMISKEKAGSSLTLDFSNKPFQLRRWKIIDQVGTEIMVTLQNHSYGMELPDKTFRGIALPVN
tara:strand:- start:143 stop:733 length:591 start_codon:yes stop_codon:yes gene_type:complete